MRSTHRAFLCSEPTDKHLRIYDGFPTLRGRSDAALDVETFEAAVIMALVQTYTKKQAPDPYTVYLFVPGSHEKWAVEQLKGMLGRLFDKLKEKKAAQQAQILANLFRHIMMGCRVLPFDQAPERWAAFGFVKADPIPIWLSEGLLPV
jgi:hypothetical protein